jgi:hypothetical protein
MTRLIRFSLNTIRLIKRVWPIDLTQSCNALGKSLTAPLRQPQ